MKFLFAGYIILGLVIFFFSMVHEDDVNKNGSRKFNWRFLLCIIMIDVAPIIAKLCGLL